MFCSHVLRAAVLSVVTAVAVPALAGSWVTPDYGDRPVPARTGTPLYWMIDAYPHIYRAELVTPSGCDRVTAVASSTGYLYVWVDGRVVLAYPPSHEDTPEPLAAHQLDLTPWLSEPGRHCIAISAPPEGLAVDGAFFAGSRRLVPLATDETWRVAEYPPTTIIEDLPVVRVGFNGEAMPVKTGKAFTATDDQLAAAHFAASVARAAQSLDDSHWRLELLAGKGIYVVDDEAHQWGDANRADPASVRSAKAAMNRITRLRDRLTALQDQPITTDAELRPALRRLRSIERAVTVLARAAEAACRAAQTADESKALLLAMSYSPATRELLGLLTSASPAETRSQLAKAIGHPLNRLNESRYDRLGWLPYPDLTDSQIGAWAIRINPVAGATTVEAPQRWLFSTDPRDKGLTELRWSIGYNIEGQWPRINATKSWTEARDFADYRGVAWYRGRVRVPAEWVGNDVVLTLPLAGNERVWVNDKEITDAGAGEGERTYTLAGDLVQYGGENYVAIRVSADGEQRGLIGRVTASCPALDGPMGKSTPPVAVLATPLSPCVVLTPRTETLQVHFSPTAKAKLLAPGRGAPIEIKGYSAAEGQLGANWVMLWMGAAPGDGPARPILWVFERNPKAIDFRSGMLKITFDQPGRRVIAVRPWAKTDPTRKGVKVDLSGTINQWSRAALAVPVNYLSVTRVIKPGESIANISVDNVPTGPVLGQTVIYDYLVTEDQWGTEPLRIAPLPALCSLAIDKQFRRLELDQSDRIDVLQDGGLAAPYRGVLNADRVSYSYDVEPWPRVIGFTSWMFGDNDTGVPANTRELQTLAAVGVNSYRPQHNLSDERVTVMTDACNIVGINYTNNIDERLGGSEQRVMNQYDEFMEDVTQHYETIARRIGDRPFWAVGYDLINEGFHHKAENYNPWMKKLTARLRAIDKRHLCYIEPIESWGSIQKLEVVEPTGDPLTMYSFHDYNFRLNSPADRWPTMDRDLADICRMWWPAFEFQITNGVGMHCGEFGGFRFGTGQRPAQTLLMADFFRVFDQFGMHFHYYSGRETYERYLDGSAMPTNVVRAFRQYMARPDVNLYYRDQLWKSRPTPEKMTQWADPSRPSRP